MQRNQLKVLGFEEVPPFAAELVQAFGMAAMNWGKLETGLDALLHNVNRKDYRTGRFREIPNTSFKLKRKLFRQCYVDDPRFAEVKERSYRLYISLGRAATDRQMLIHSAVEEFIQGPPVAIRIAIMRHDNAKQKITVDRGNITIEQIKESALKLARLTRGMAELERITTTDDFQKSLETTPGPTQRGIGLVRRTKCIVCALARRLVRATCR